MGELDRTFTSVRQWLALCTTGALVCCAFGILAVPASATARTSALGLVLLPPVAPGLTNADAATIHEREVARLDVLANDNVSIGSVVATAFSAPRHGIIETSPSGAVTYTPEWNWSGTDVFTYRMSYTYGLTYGLSEQTTVTITVQPLDDPPVAVSDGQLAQMAIRASDGGGNVNFGYSVAVDGDTAVIGAPGDSRRAQSAGAVYVYVRSGDEWIKQSVLTAEDGGTGDQLGYSVSVSGNTIIAGAQEDDNGNGDDAGAAYVFSRYGNTWTQRKLVAADGRTGDFFGWSVAISGDTAVVGANGRDGINGEKKNSGAAYVFNRDGEEWTQTRLAASDSYPYAFFGQSVALSGDTLVVAAPYDSSTVWDSGAAYVFTRRAGSWAEVKKLAASDATRDAEFGTSVAISGHSIIVGAYRDHTFGSAYLFTSADGSWDSVSELKLRPSSGSGQQWYGWSVAISGDVAMVGAPLDDAESYKQGAVWVYTRTGAEWVERRYASQLGTSGEGFGAAVALWHDQAFVGSPWDDTGARLAGSVRAFSVQQYDCDEDTSLTVPAGLGLLSNDRDADGDVIIPALMDTSALHGTLSFGAGGSFTYVPEKDFEGTATATYHDLEFTGWSNVATITIAVHPVDDAPVARDDAPAVVVSGVGRLDLLGNDTDIDDPHASLVATAFSTPAHGVVQSDASGHVTYTPAPGWVGADTFVYKVFDGQLYSAPATVTIQVVPRPVISSLMTTGAVTPSAGSYTDAVAAPDTDGGTTVYLSGPHGRDIGIYSDGTHRSVTVAASRTTPKCSPRVSGDKVVFISGTDVMLTSTRAGSTPRNLTPPRGGHDGAATGLADVSGRFVAYSRYSYTSHSVDVYVYDTVKQSTRRVTSGRGNDYVQAISGSGVVYLSSGRLYVRSLAGRTADRIPTAGVLASARGANRPSIDGGRVAYIASVSGVPQVFVYDITRKTVSQITSGPGRRSDPSISGNRVAYAFGYARSAALVLFDLSSRLAWRLGSTGVSQISMSGGRLTWVDVTSAHWNAGAPAGWFGGQLIAGMLQSPRVQLVLPAASGVVSYAARPVLSARALDASGAPLPDGTPVLCEWSTDGTHFSAWGTAYVRSGSVGATAPPLTRARFLRFRYSGRSASSGSIGALSALSRAVKLTPRVVLSAPSGRTSAWSRSRFTVSGTLTPAHSGSAVRVYAYRWVRGAWHLEKVFAARLTRSGDRSDYAAAVSLTAGTWRLKAFSRADSLHAATFSTGFLKVVVRAKP